MTVSGLTITSHVCQPLSQRERQTQKNRSRGRRRGRRTERCKMASCWRKAKFSAVLSATTFCSFLRGLSPLEIGNDFGKQTQSEGVSAVAVEQRQSWDSS
jgi:hypothetical protein